MKLRMLAALVAAATLLASTFAALAGNTVLFSSTTGDITFPITPTTIDGMSIGATTPAPGKFTDLNASGQITSSAGAPTIASGGCGTGTNGTVAGTNQAGKVTIGAAATTACTVRFSATLGAIPKACVLFPANAAAAATGTTVAYVSSITAAQFVITGTALANTVYGFICL